MGRRPAAPVVEQDAEHGDVFQYRFTAHGRRFRGSTGCRDREAAQAETLRLYAAALAQKPLPKADAARRPVASQDLTKLFAAFIGTVTGKKSPEYIRKMESHFSAHFARRWRTLSEIVQPGAIDAFASARLAGDAPAFEHDPRRKRPKNGKSVTVHKELVTLRRFLKWCKKMGHIAELPHIDPVAQVSDYTPPDLTPDQVATYLAALPTRREHRHRHPVRERFTFMWAQALRNKEVSSLRRRDVNLELREMTIRQSEDKARVGRTIGLSDEAHDALVEYIGEETWDGDALLFGDADYRTQLEHAAEATGLPVITPHHLRHFRLTELGHEPGTSVAALQFFAGHKHLSTTDKYVRSRTAATHEMLASAKASRAAAAARAAKKKRPAKRGGRRRG